MKAVPDGLKCVASAIDRQAEKNSLRHGATTPVKAVPYNPLRRSAVA